MVTPALQPWEIVGWSPEQEQIIYRDWGRFFTHRQQLDTAVHYYNKSLELKSKDPKTLYFRSRCKRNIAQTKGALDDGKTAAAFDDFNARINLEICDALYELNQFENCAVELHDNTRKFCRSSEAGFLNRLVVVEENLKDSLGDPLGSFILKSGNHFAAVAEDFETNQHIDARPLWKILKEQDGCDIISILEKEEVLLSPLELARRRRAFKVCNQIYLKKTWIDVFFLKHLQENKNFLLPQSKGSTPVLHSLCTTKCDEVTKFLKMLQARSPLYAEKLRMCPNKRLGQKRRDEYLNRVQYQTRRTILSQLRAIRRLRNEGDIEKLSKYVEEVMGDYVVLKSLRVMPWKVEFINEVYNTLALAHVDSYTLLEDVLQTHGKERLLRLLRMPTDKLKDIVEFVFGDKSTYREADAPNYDQMAYQKFLARLQKRLIFTKYPVEKCYLLHEIARVHLKQSSFEQCCSWARKAIEASEHSNNLLWQLLSIMLIVKAHAALHKLESGKEALKEAMPIVKRLAIPKLCSFIDFCHDLNEQEIALKKSSQSMDSMRKRRSRASISSRNSSQSKNGSENGDSAKATISTARASDGAGDGV